MKDNDSVSLVSVALIIVGIVACAVAPPIGILVFVFAFFSQRGFRKRIRGHRQVEYAKARARLDREKILAAKSLS